MSVRKTELHIDRIEDNIAVAYDSNGNEYFIREKIFEIKENDIIEATLSEEGFVTEISVLHKKTEDKKQFVKKLLSDLFSKGV